MIMNNIIIFKDIKNNKLNSTCFHKALCSYLKGNNNNLSVLIDYARIKAKSYLSVNTRVASRGVLPLTSLTQLKKAIIAFPLTFYRGNLLPFSSLN